MLCALRFHCLCKRFFQIFLPQAKHRLKNLAHPLKRQAVRQFQKTHHSDQLWQFAEHVLLLRYIAAFVL